MLTPNDDRKLKNLYVYQSMIFFLKNHPVCNIQKRKTPSIKFKFYRDSFSEN